MKKKLKHLILAKIIYKEILQAVILFFYSHLDISGSLVLYFINYLYNKGKKFAASHFYNSPFSNIFHN